MNSTVTIAKLSTNARPAEASMPELNNIYLHGNTIQTDRTLLHKHRPLFHPNSDVKILEIVEHKDALEICHIFPAKQNSETLFNDKLFDLKNSKNYMYVWGRRLIFLCPLC